MIKKIKLINMEEIIATCSAELMDQISFITGE